MEIKHSRFMNHGHCATRFVSAVLLTLHRATSRIGQRHESEWRTNNRQTAATWYQLRRRIALASSSSPSVISGKNLAFSPCASATPIRYTCISGFRFSRLPCPASESNRRFMIAWCLRDSKASGEPMVASKGETREEERSRN